MTRIRLLVIDPQNDFMDVAGAALPVPGASADMTRLAGFVDALGPAIDDLVVTLDSHASVGIERTTFWVTADGAAVAPFTLIRAADVHAGTYTPRNPARRQEVVQYLEALEAGSGRTLIVWPVHCVLGTWGHNIHPALAESIARWEYTSSRTCDKVLKGLNPLTEQYSAFRAEVPRADDARTRNNDVLMARLAAGDEVLVVAGEALSHCVAASGEDMLAQLDPARLRNTVFLTDCMSPVTGFEAAGQQFLQQLREHGVRTMGSAEAAHALRT
jgi:nicotinamidase-related amidase